MRRIHHIHIKAPDPGKTAAWWVEAFAFKIVSDEVRPFGDRFIRCTTEDGFAVTISGARTGETLGPGDAAPHFGLEHVAFESAAIEADIARPDVAADLLHPDDRAGVLALDEQAAEAVARLVAS